MSYEPTLQDLEEMHEAFLLNEFISFTQQTEVNNEKTKQAKSG